MRTRLITLLILTEILFSTHSKAQPQSTDDFMKYMKENSVSIKEASTKWNDVLDSAFYDNNFFWVGESHGIKYSYSALWILFKEIHKKVGLNYLLIESGYISELYLKKYMDTGDEDYLIKNFSAAKGTMGCNEEAYEFYKKLYQYNKNLPKSEQIELVSIDIEHQYRETDNYIRTLLQNKELPVDSYDPVNLFLNTSEDYNNKYEILASDLKNNPLKYKSVLKADYFDFCYMVRNINYLFKAKSSENWNITRDSLMFENYKIRLKDHNFISSKVFAYFGSNHCYLRQTNEVPWIASLINESNPKVKSTSVMFLYSECEAMRPMWGITNNKQKYTRVDNDFVNVSFDNDIKKIYRKSIKDNFVLINIKNTNVTFWSARYLQYFVDRDSLLHDYFDYFLFIKDSPATEPYSELKHAQQ